MATKKKDPWGDDPLDRDLSEFFKEGGWQWAIVDAPKDTTVTLRLPAALVKQVKDVAKKHGLKYQGLMRRFIIEGAHKATAKPSR